MGEKIHYAATEVVVAIARHHVAGSGDIDEFSVRDKAQKVVGIFFTQKITHSSSDQKRGHCKPASGVVQSVK